MNIISSSSRHKLVSWPLISTKLSLISSPSTMPTAANDATPPTSSPADTPAIEIASTGPTDKKDQSISRLFFLQSIALCLNWRKSTCKSQGMLQHLSIIVNTLHQRTFSLNFRSHHPRWIYNYHIVFLRQFIFQGSSLKFTLFDYIAVKSFNISQFQASSIEIASSHCIRIFIKGDHFPLLELFCEEEGKNTTAAADVQQTHFCLASQRTDNLDVILEVSLICGHPNLSTGKYLLPIQCLHHHSLLLILFLRILSQHFSKGRELQQMLMLATIQTTNKGKPIPNVSSNLSLQMEHSERSGAVAICILIRCLDLPTHRLPLLATIQLRNTFRKDVNSHFFKHPRRSTDFMRVYQFCGWLSDDKEVIGFRRNPHKFFKGL